MKILICDSVAQQAIDWLKSAGFEVVVQTGMDQDALIKAVPGYDAMVVRSATKVREPAINAMDTMKLIVRGGVGLDNIDVDVAVKKGIRVMNTPGASSVSVAELAIGHMFALARFIPAATMAVKAGEWPKKQMKGIELNGKILGIIGIGRIGQEVAKRAHALGMTCLAYDEYIKTTPLPGMVGMVSKDILLGACDFLTLHIPFDKKMGATIKAEDFKKIKKGMFIVNCARGGTIDEKPLLDALNDGTVARIALDVFEKEPPEFKELVAHPNVYITPHIGASTEEGQFRVGIEVAEILIRELKK